MAYQIKYNDSFLKEAPRIANWLEKKWSKKVADNFSKKLNDKINSLALNPYACSSTHKKDVRKLVITKYNKIYYRVRGNIITILIIFDTRQNPKKNKYE